MTKKMRAEGFTATGVAIIIFVIVAIGLAGWYVAKQNSETPPTKSVQKSSQSRESKVSDYEGWQRYSNQKYGVTMKYPAGWTLEEVPISSPSGSDPVEFAANLKISSTEKYGEALVFEVHTTSMNSVEQLKDSTYAQSSLNEVVKKETSLKGKQAVSYLVTNSGVQSKTYLFGVGPNTYELSSTNEELNSQRSSNYWSDFDKVFDSLTIK